MSVVMNMTFFLEGLAVLCVASLVIAQSNAMIISYPYHVYLLQSHADFNIVF